MLRIGLLSSDLANVERPKAANDDISDAIVDAPRRIMFGVTIVSVVKLPNDKSDRVMYDRFGSKLIVPFSLNVMFSCSRISLKLINN